MQLLRFKCKVTGRTYQEQASYARCEGCAFRSATIDLEEMAVRYALGKHCLGVDCIQRQTIFVEVTE